MSKPADIIENKTHMYAVLQYELEQKKRSESPQNVPEFVRVRGTLKRVQTFSL